MKDVFKSLAFFVFRLSSRIETTVFSRFFTSWGYAIKCESLYNSIDVKTFSDRIDMHQYLVKEHFSENDPIVFLEFGVYKGQTYLIWLEGNKNPASRFAGFDTFTGLPEDWGNIKAGSFSAGGRLPAVSDPRSQFCVGLIQDTLPEFVKTLSADQRKVIHIDVDLYNASLITLIHLQPYLRAGDVLIFDDFFTITKAAHEFRAFSDFLALYPFAYKPLYKCRNGHLVLEITGRA
jgi:hypothetical protein